MGIKDKLRKKRLKEGLEESDADGMSKKMSLIAQLIVPKLVKQYLPDITKHVKEELEKEYDLKKK